MFSTQIVAKALNVSPQTVRNYADEGIIPHQKTLKGHRRYDLADVERALRRAQVRSFEPLQENEAPRLAATTTESIGRGGPTRRRIARSSLATVPTADAPTLDIPLIGTPGTSRFVVGVGAGTR